MRSSCGVRARVWLRIQDSGTLQRDASSTESISSGPFPLLWDINWTSYLCGCDTAEVLLASCELCELNQLGYFVKFIW